jgi:AcrR family transcriptional regulator
MAIDVAIYNSGSAEGGAPDVAGPRLHDQILEAATRLFYEQGINATSVDRVIAEADVAPMTVYRHFGGKDELVTATLDRWSARWLQWLQDEVDGSGKEPGAGFGGLWDALEKWCATEGFRGSYVANAANELRGRPDHPAHRSIALHRAATRQLLEDVARTAGAPHPTGAALQLQLLIDGAMTVAMVDRQPGVAASARAVANTLVLAGPGS